MSFINISRTAVVFIVACQVHVLSPNIAFSQENTPVSENTRQPRWRLGHMASVRDIAETQGPLFLLQVPLIQEHLQLTSQQVETIVACEKTYSKSMKDLWASVDINDKTKRDISFDMAKDKIVFERKSSIIKVIGRPAYRRLCEISFQIQGPTAVFFPEIQEILQLDQNQVDDIYIIKSEYANALRKLDEEMNSILIKSASFDTSIQSKVERLNKVQKQLDAVTPKLDEIYRKKELLRSSASKSIKNVLTHSQQINMKKFMGKPIDSKIVDELLKPGGGNWKKIKQ